MCFLLILFLSISSLCVHQEEAIPELEIDVDELLDMPSDVDRASRVKVQSRLSEC